MPPRARDPGLKRHLDLFLDGFPRETHLEADPVRFAHRYSRPADREIAGFIGAAFAYGNVRSVLRSVEAALAPLGPRPADSVAGFDPRRDARIFRGFVHRWNDEKDLAVLVWILGRLLERFGSLEAAFAAGLSPADPFSEGALERFSTGALAFGHERFYSKRDLGARRGVRYFFPRPSGGSACKRLNLYLRWMVRPDDGVDCGLWTRLRPRQLVIPLDTHIARISRYIGLTEVASPGWKMALDITASLKRLDAEDPLRYDFALCHLGIAGDCPRKRDPWKCAHCPIQAVCRL